MSVVQVTDEELATMADNAKTICTKFNKLFDDPMSSLQLYARMGKIDIVVQEVEGEAPDMQSFQRAFLSLSDRIAHDHLRFGSGFMGSIWADFTDDDDIEWRAALNPHPPKPPSTAVYEIMLCKL